MARVGGQLEVHGRVVWHAEGGGKLSGCAVQFAPHSHDPSGGLHNSHPISHSILVTLTPTQMAAV